MPRGGQKGQPCVYCNQSIVGKFGVWKVIGEITPRCEASPTLRHKPSNVLNKRRAGGK